MLLSPTTSFVIHFVFSCPGVCNASHIISISRTVTPLSLLDGQTYHSSCSPSTLSSTHRSVLHGNRLSPQLDRVLIQHILERKQKRRRQHTLRDLGCNSCITSSLAHLPTTLLTFQQREEKTRELTTIQPTPPLLPDNPAQRRRRALLSPLTNMHPALDRDIWVRDTRRGQLPQRTQVERIRGRRRPLPASKS